MLLIYFSFVFIGYVDSRQNSSCAPLNLTNGRVTYSYSNVADLKCKRNYVLIGAKLDFCHNGTWIHGNQICARKNCPKLPKPYHGDVGYTNKRAVAEFKCNINFILVGSSELYCLDNGWNGSVPVCEAKYLEMLKPCHFEIDDPAHCHWLLKPSVFKWVVYPMENMYPDSVADDLPPYDHSLGPHTGGHYLLLVRQNAKLERTQAQNSSPEAQFISPQFPATINSKDPLCLIFYYYVSEGATLRMLINNETIWISNQPLERKWTEAKISLQNQPYAFRIIVDGVKNSPNRSTLAIDDLRLDTRGSCNSYSSGVILSQTSDTISYTSQPSINPDHEETDESTFSTFVESTTIADTMVSENTEENSTSFTGSVGNYYESTVHDYEPTVYGYESTVYDYEPTVYGYESTSVFEESSSLPNAIDLQEIPATTYIFSMPEPVSPSISSQNSTDELSQNINQSAIDRFQKISHSLINVTSFLRSNITTLGSSIQHEISLMKTHRNMQGSQEITTNAGSVHLSTSITFDNASGNRLNPDIVKKVDPDMKAETPSTEEIKISKETAIPSKEIHQNIETDLKDNVITETFQNEHFSEFDQGDNEMEYSDSENYVDMHGEYQKPAVQTYYDSNPDPVHSHKKMLSLPELVIYVSVLLLSLITPAFIYFSRKLLLRYIKKRRDVTDNIKLCPQDRESIEINSSYPLTIVEASD